MHWFYGHRTTQRRSVLLFVLATFLFIGPIAAQDATPVPADGQVPVVSTDIPATDAPTPVPTDVLATDVPPTEVPTATQELLPTLTETEVPVVEPTSIPSESPPQSVPVVVFSDDFQDNETSGWGLSSGWALQNNAGNLALAATLANATATISGLSLQDFNLTTKVRLDEANTLNVFLRTGGESYRVQVDADGRVGLYRGDTLLGASPEAMPQSAESVSGSSEHLLSIRLLGSVITVTVDGITQVDVIDSSPLGAGGITFATGTQNTGTAAIDDVVIESLATTPESTPTSVVPTPLPTEATPLEAEPELGIAFSDTFSTETILPVWTLGTDWSLAADDQGQYLQARNDSATVAGDPILNLAVQARFQIAAGEGKLSLRQSAVGSYTATLGADNHVNLYRGEALMSSGTATTLSGGTWHILRLSAFGDVIRVAVDGVEVIALRDDATLPPGGVGLAVASISDSPIQVDDFALWRPLNEISSSTPEATATITPTAKAVIQESDLALLLEENFDQVAIDLWQTGTGWASIIVGDENALQVSGSTEPLGLIYAVPAIAAAQVDVRLTAGTVRFTLNGSAQGGYTVELSSAGDVHLYRQGTLVGTATVPALAADQAHTIKLSVINGTLRASINEQQVMTYEDASPLPTGGISLSAILPDSAAIQVDHFKLWGITSKTSALPVKPTVDKVQSELSKYASQANAPIQLLTDQWAVILKPGTNAAALAQQLGFEYLSTVGDLPDTYVFRKANTTLKSSISTAAAKVLSSSPGVVSFEQQLATQPVKLSVVNKPESSVSAFDPLVDPTDPLFPDQWHLRNTGQFGGTSGQDANVVPAWNSVDGTGVTIAIVDDSLEHTHPDLSPHYRPDGSYDFIQNNADPAPVFAADNHGTSVAGVAAAAANNGTCGVGAAYGANLSGIRLIGGFITDAQFASALTYKNSINAIYSNSWGPQVNTVLGPGPLALAAMQSSVTNGRGGRGSIYVFAAGNGNEYLDNVNANGFANSRFAIAVGAFDNTGVRSYYSNPGTAVFVTAPSNGYSSGTNVGIRTTDRIGSNGYELGDCNHGFSGTSSATPLVSGIIALMLQANPNLGWRDVQHILALTAYQIDPTDGEWTTNGDGFHVNPKYGFGRIDAAAAVSMAQTWVNVPAVSSYSSATQIINQPITDNDPIGVGASLTMNVPDPNFVIERVQIVFTATHRFRGDLEVELTSPSGVVSQLITARPDGGDNYVNWPFMTVHDWSEKANGAWYLRVADVAYLDVGTFNSWKLILYGYSRPAPVLTAPTNGSSTNNTTPTFNWNTVPSFKGTATTDYQIQIDNNSNFSSPEYDVTGNGLTTFIPPSALPDGTYYWRVRSGNLSASFGAWSVSVASTVIVDTVAPPAPTLTTPLNNVTLTTARPAFTWGAVTVANRYRLQVDDNSDFSSPEIDVFPITGILTSTSVSYALTTSLQQETHYWQVQAYDAANNVGVFSASRQFNVNIQLLPADGAVLIVPASALPTFTWTAVPNAPAASYRLQVATDTGFSNIVYNITQVGTSHTTLAGSAFPFGVYYWRVILNLGAGYIPSPFYFRLVVSPTAPPAPTLASPVTTTITNNNTPTLSWNAVTYGYSVVTYQVQVDNTATFASPEYNGTAISGTSATTSTLADGVYSWRVRAVNNLGAPGSFSAVRTLTVDTIAPAAPVLTTPTANAVLTTARPTFTWGAVVGANRYRLQVDNNGDFSSPEVDKFPLTVVTYTLPSSLQPGTLNWNWRVFAVDAAGNESVASVGRTFTVKIQLSPANGAVLAATPTIMLKWQVVLGAVGYQVQVASTSDFLTDLKSYAVNSGAVGTLVVPGAAVAGSYYWRVNVNLGSGLVDNPFSRSFTVAGVAPLAPTLVSPATASWTGDNTPTLTWTSESELVGRAVTYEVQVDNTATFATQEYSATGLSGASTITSALLSGIYNWRVRAVSSTSTPGPFSAVRTLTVDTIAPAAPVLTAPAANAVLTTARPTFTWGAVVGANRYRLQVDNNGDFSSPEVDKFPLTVVTYALPSSLQPGTLNWNWRVFAVDAAGNESVASVGRTFTVKIQLAPANGAVLAATPTIMLKWQVVLGAVGYQVQVASTSDFLTDLKSYAVNSGAVGTLVVPGASVAGSYYWRVNVNLPVSGLVENPFSRSFTVAAVAPLTPTLVSPATASWTGDNTPTLTWTSVSELVGRAVTYEIQVDNTATFATQEYSATGLTGTSTITSALLSGIYSWRVRAVSSASIPGSFSAVRTLTVDTIAPAAPVLTTPTANAVLTTARPTFTWGAVVGANRYRLQVDNNGDFSSPEVDKFPLTVVTYTLPSSLQPGTLNWNWRVFAVDAAGNESVASVGRTFTVKIQLSPANGAVLAATPTIMLKWQVVLGAVGYQVQVASTSDFLTDLKSYAVNSGAVGTLVVPGAAVAGSYYWRVNVNLGSGLVENPFSRSFTVAAVASLTPTLVSPATASWTGDNTPTLTWTSVSELVGRAVTYEIQVDNTATFALPEYSATGLSGASTTTTTLPDGTYNWRVRAVSSTPGPYSAVRTFTVDLP